MDGWMLQWSTADFLFTFSLFFYFSRVITYTSLHRRPVLVVCLFSMTFYYYYYYILMIIVARSSGGWVTTRWSGCCSCGIPTFSHNIWKGKTSFRVLCFPKHWLCVRITLATRPWWWCRHNEIVMAQLGHELIASKEWDWVVLTTFLSLPFGILIASLGFSRVLSIRNKRNGHTYTQRQQQCFKSNHVNI